MYVLFAAIAQLNLALLSARPRLGRVALADRPAHMVFCHILYFYS